MKVITIHQPWASLIMAGAKPYELRRWRPPASLIGQRIGIHASARKVDHHHAACLFIAHREQRRDPVLAGPAETCLLSEKALPILSKAWAPHDDPLPTGVILGTVQLGEPRTMAEVTQELGGLAQELYREDASAKPLWGWPMLDVFRWDRPVPARGTQGFWTWTRPIERPRATSTHTQLAAGA